MAKNKELKLYTMLRRKITGSIKNKLLLLFLLAILIPLAISFLVTESAMFSMKEKSENLLVDEALSSSKTFTNEEAVKIDAQLNSIIETIYATRDFTEYLYLNSSDFKRNKVNTPDEFSKNSQGRTIHWLPCDAKADTDDVAQEAYLLGNLQPMLDSTLNNSEMITSIYITTKTGINLGYDENVVSKQGLGYFETREGYDWYTYPKDSGEIYISDAYTDTFGRGLMVTIAVPYSVKGEFQGVIGADINIENINKAILDISLGDEGYAMLVSDEGQMISAESMVEGASIEAKDYFGVNGQKVVNAMKHTNSGFTTGTIDGKSVYVIFSKVENTSWRLAVVLPVQQIIAPAQQSNRFIVTINVFLVAFYVIITFIMMVYVGKSCNKISYPIIHLTSSMKKIESGNLNYASDIYTGDEIQALSKGFESMTISLKEYIGNLTNVTAEKERIGAELNVATKIQADMLPRIFPAFPERREFDVYASMNPAKEVGGDFYDFFMVDGDHLAVVMADVSGKGVPAALFMVVAKTLIKNQTMNGMQPCDVFTTVNNQLCEGNDTGLFVTAWMGVLEISSGRFSYANAGHNSPLLKRKGASYEWLKSKPGFVLAGMEEIKYTQNETILSPGDKLFLYTDGVTEALNQEKELFSDERLIRTLNERNIINMNVTQLLKTVKRYVISYADGAEQADDITMLGLEYRGNKEYVAQLDREAAELKAAEEEAKKRAAEATEEKPIEEKPAEEKPAEEKPTEEKPAEEKPAEEKPAEEKPTEEKPAEEKPAEEKPAEEKPSEEKFIETEDGENKGEDIIQEDSMSEVRVQAREMRAMARQDKEDAQGMIAEAQEMRAKTQKMRENVEPANEKQIEWDAEETMVAEVGNLEHVINCAQEMLHEMGASEKHIMSISVTIEEIFVNITNYAYAPENGAVSISMKKDMARNAFIMCFADHGIAYNPLEKPDPNTTLSAEDREIGGLGIFMVKKSVDDITYERVGDKNILTFWKVVKENE